MLMFRDSKFIILLIALNLYISLLKNTPDGYYIK